MANIEVLTIEGIECYEQDNVCYLRLEAVARGLGFVQEKNGVEYVRWDRVEGYLEEFGFPHKWGKGDFIPENIFYRLAMKAKNEVGERFQCVVADKVLPSIRKHGAYMTPATLDQMIASPEFGIRLLTELKEERDRRKEVEAQKVALEAKVEADRPKVAFADAVEGSYSTILVRDLAKILRQNGVEMGEKRLFEWLRNKGYLIRQAGRSYNLPTQRALESGLFEVKETAITHTTGTQTHLTPLVTGKGQKYFVNLFLANKMVEDKREA